MLKGIEIFLIDLQDVGARLYTYIWTVKLCMEACAEAGIPVWLLDRPNPIALLPFDGPVLKERVFYICRRCFNPIMSSDDNWRNGIMD